MTSLFEILDGIVDVDGINSENTITALNDIEYIKDYASNGLDMHITDQEATRISAAGLRWIDEVKNGNGEWSRMRHEAMRALETEV